MSWLVHHIPELSFTAEEFKWDKNKCDFFYFLRVLNKDLKCLKIKIWKIVTVN
jgi:hypothetical protein